MNDPMNMSVEEILAACRRADGGGAQQSAGDATPKAESQQAKAEQEKPPASGKKPGQMSVEEILAAARAEKEKKEGKGAAQSAAKAPATAASEKKPGQMSVAEILAAARGEKAKAAKPPAKPAAAAKTEAKDKAPAGKDKAAKAADRKGPRDTASILAAARKAAKPGPVSKQEAAARGAAATDRPPVQRKKKIEVPPPPPRPAYLDKAEAAEPREGRRSFFAALAGVFVGSSLAVGFTSLALTHLLWALGLARFMFPNILIEPPMRFKVGFPDDYAPGQVETRYKAQFGVWIVRYEYEGQPQIYALRSVCTHLGCTPNWLEAEQKFKCPCHGSGFYKDGINFEGPAPRPLERFAIHIADDGQLEVDKSRTFLEEKGEWRNPESYVPV